MKKLIIVVGLILIFAGCNFELYDSVTYPRYYYPTYRYYPYYPYYYSPYYYRVPYHYTPKHYTPKPSPNYHYGPRRK